MKKFSCFLCFLLFSSSFIFAQIPNNGFENWSGGNPNDWFTTNIPGLLVPVTQSGESHSGASAVKMEVLLFNNEIYPPFLTSSNFAVDQRYGSLVGYYKFSPVNANNSLFISITLAKDNNFTAGGAVEISAAASAYTQFVVPIQYANEEVPNSAVIQILVSDSSENMRVPGSIAFIDDLAFGGPVNIEDEHTPIVYNLKQNYPNPFNPSTKIEYSVPQKSFVQITVYDIIGNKVAVLMNEEKISGNYSVNFDGSSLPSGIYIVQMKAGSFVKSLKMTLLK